MRSSLEQLAEDLLGLLIQEKKRITTAESCTGGWVAKALTDIAGSSSAFECGYVTYSNAAKQQMLGVTGKTLDRYGAVSEQTVHEMATAALKHSQADIAVAISGIAGPGGGSIEKPVGMVCFAWALKAGPVKTETRQFAGKRQAIRYASVQHCLNTAIQIIQNPRC